MKKIKNFTYGVLGIKKSIKIFLQTLVEIIFKHNLFFGTPLQTKRGNNENFTYGVLGIKIG